MFCWISFIKWALFRNKSTHIFSVNGRFGNRRILLFGWTFGCMSRRRWSGIILFFRLETLHGGILGKLLLLSGLIHLWICLSKVKFLLIKLVILIKYILILLLVCGLWWMLLAGSFLYRAWLRIFFIWFSFWFSLGF